MNKFPPTTLNFNAIPSHYTLEFEPNFSTFTYQAKATISLTLQKAIKLITLHAKELTIKNVQLLHNKITYEPQIHVNEPKEELQLTLPKALKGPATIIIDYQGLHNDQMYGFYRSSYTQNNKQEYMLTTQFEAANARAAFPCFDEPFFKATFDVSIKTEKTLTVISNMPIKKEIQLGQNKKQVVFQTSPKMSTYLLYLGIGNFLYKAAKLNNIDIRVYTTPDKIKYADLSLQYTKTFLDYFQKYFQLRYPLPKLDMLAIPDFASGAMENWGAITFREIALLGDEHTSVVVKQNIAITVAHELAHQWFGNLVTMQWWDDLWLNESFATFMSYKAVHASYPEWELPLQYFEDTICNALSADQLISTHPINVKVNTPGEVDEIFDHISYDKGGSVLHMLEHFVGETTFQQGLTKYLQKYSYNNATKYDLWTQLQQVSQKRNLTSMVHRWITLPGYPLITVKKTKTGYELTQQRFTLKHKTFNQQWLIPIVYQTAQTTTTIPATKVTKAAKTIKVIKDTTDVTTKHLLLSAKTQNLKESSPWIKLNAHQDGFYRVAYDAQTLKQLGIAIKQKTISTLDAAGLENDLFALTIQGKYTLSTYLGFIEQYCLDATYPLNSSISSHLGSLFRLTYNKKTAFTQVQTLSTTFHTKLLKQLGWERKKNEPNTTTMLRSMTIFSLGLANHKPTLTQAATLFQQLKNKNNLDQNIRGAIYNLAAWRGKEDTFNYLVEKYKNEPLPEEQRRLLRALSMFPSTDLQHRALALSLTSTIRLQDSYVIPLSLSGNPTCTFIWPWTSQHWLALMKKYSSGTHMLPHFVQNLAGTDNTKEQQEIKTFFAQKQHQRDDIKMAITQTLERIDVIINFLEKNKVK